MYYLVLLITCFSLFANAAAFSFALDGRGIWSVVQWFCLVCLFLSCCFNLCWLVVGLGGSKIGVQKVGKMVLGYGRSAKLNFRAYRNPFRFLAKNGVFSKSAEIEGLV